MIVTDEDAVEDDVGDDVVADDDAPDAADAPLATTDVELAALRAAWPGVDLGERGHLHADGSPVMVERHFVVEDHLAGHRLDHYLKRMIPRLSRTKVQQVIRTQLSGPPGRTIKPNASVAAGDEWVIRRPARREPPCPRTFTVLHEDDDLIVIDKPAGLPVHASAKFYFNTLTRVLAERYPDQVPQICHRLDRETSGALVCARHRDAASAIKRGFAAKTIAKTYLAIVHGQPPWPDEIGEAPGLADHVIDLPLAVAGLDDETELPGVRMVVRADGLPSLTRVRVVERDGPYALVRCTPVTGRQHQIRAHLAAVGFPIVGDKLYAHGDRAFMTYCDRGLTPELAALFELPRQALHAASVDLPHPTKAERLRVDSPLAGDLRAFLQRVAERT